MFEVANVILQENAVIITPMAAPWTGIKSKRNENGEVLTEALSAGRVFAERDLCGEMETSLMGGSVLDYWKTYVLLIMAGLVISAFTHTLVYVVPIMIFLWDLGEVFGDYKFAGYIAAIKKYNKPEYKAYWRMNAAVNQVFNAYREKERIPTIEESQKFSRFCKKSRITRIFRRFFYFSIVTILLSLTPIYTASDSILKATIVSIGIILFDCAVAFIVKKKFDKYGEIFFLRKPTENELAVVIAAVEKTEEFLQNSVNENPREIVANN